MRDSWLDTLNIIKRFAWVPAKIVKNNIFLSEGNITISCQLGLKSKLKMLEFDLLGAGKIISRYSGWDALIK